MRNAEDEILVSAQVEKGRAPLVDAHHHLWRFNEAEFGWIDDSMAMLRRDFLVNELQQEIEAAGIDATVAVQARESMEETYWLLECARSTSFIHGVVGWAPLTSEKLPELLDAFDEQKKLVGFREVVQGKPSGYLLQTSFNRGIQELGRRGFSYDVLIQEHQLVEAGYFVDRHPNQRFVLDHAAKPKIAVDEFEPWKRNLLELARRPNVSCKISGLVTEADWRSWTPESLAPYLDVCVEAFGSGRLMAGSDWPVCLLASGYSRWWDVLTGYFADFSGNETRRIFGENAVEFYKLRDLTSM
jgi:L-fuconolactonase